MVILNPTSAAHNGLANNRKAKITRVFFIFLPPSKNIFFFVPGQTLISSLRTQKTYPYSNPKNKLHIPHICIGRNIAQGICHGQREGGLAVQFALHLILTPTPKKEKGLLLTPWNYWLALEELLCHKTSAMTQRYFHSAPEQLQNAVKLLAGAIGKR